MLSEQGFAVIYKHVSKLQRQRMAIEAFAKNAGLQIVAEFLTRP